MACFGVKSPACLLLFFQFLKRVLISFKQNQGLLLANDAYYTLLSLIPLVTLSIVALSHIIDEQELLDIVPK